MCSLDISVPIPIQWQPCSEDLEAAGEVTGLRRSLLRCLLPRSGGAPGVRDDVAGEAKVVQRETRSMTFGGGPLGKLRYDMIWYDMML